MPGGTTCREESNRRRMEESIRFKSVFNTDMRCSVDGRKRYGINKAKQKNMFPVTDRLWF